MAIASAGAPGKREMRLNEQIRVESIRLIGELLQRMEADK